MASPLILRRTRPVKRSSTNGVTVMDRLFDYAHCIGVTVEFSNDLDPRHPGEFCNHTRHMRLLDGMTRVKTEGTFGHELGHATLEHVSSMFLWLNAKQERAADEWASRFLIDPCEYRIAEEKFGAHTEWIAQELGVLHRLVLAYERTLHRIGDVVYVNPRMGIGNWDARFEAAA